MTFMLAACLRSFSVRGECLVERVNETTTFEALIACDMALKTGQRGFLLLSSAWEEPLWRECLVACVKSEHLQVIVAITESEAEEHGVTTLSTGNALFTLVKVRADQLRLGCSAAYLGLEAEEDRLLTKARSMISSDEELVYATASEEPPRRRRPNKAAAADEAVSESGSDDQSSAEGFGELMQKLKKGWLDEPTSKGSAGGSSTKGSKKHKFNLLRETAARSSSSSKKGEDNLPDFTKLVSAQGAKVDVNTLLTLELVKTLKGKHDKKTKKRSRDTSSSGSSETRQSRSSSSRGSVPRARGHAKAVADYDKAWRRMKRRPMKVVSKYVKELEREIGAEDGLPYKLCDYGRRIAWNKQRSLQRAHYMISSILELLLKKKVEQAALLAVLCLRSLHQAALDHGDWTVAWMITHLPDVFGKKTFGGDAEDLQHVTAYLKSMQELDKNARAVRRQEWAQSTAEDDKTKGNPKGAGKNKDKDQS